MSGLSELVYPLPKRYTQWGDAIASPQAYFMGNDSMWNSRLRMGFSVIKKDLLQEVPHFHHTIDEYYLFSGSNILEFFDFDVEIDIWIGEHPDRMEKYTITKPSIVRIPAGMWHGPIHYRNVKKPVAFSAVYFDGDRAKITRRLLPDGTVEYPSFPTGLKRCVYDKSTSCSYCGKCVREYLGKGDELEKAYHPILDFAYDWAKELVNSEPYPHTGKYDELFWEYPVEYHNREDYASPRGKFRGITQMPGATFYGGFSVALKDTVMEVPHTHYSNDEYMWFIGSDLEHPFDFDAEVELDLGWSLDKMETIVIKEPTVVRIPPLLWHTPIRFKNVKKPVAFFPVYPDGDWSKVLPRKDENGNDEFLFVAASLTKCVYNHDITCWHCGKCQFDPKSKHFGVLAR